MINPYKHTLGNLSCVDSIDIYDPIPSDYLYEILNSLPPKKINGIIRFNTFLSITITI
jgi:hypothetical protein